MIRKQIVAMSIDKMKAGPELNRLACEAVGIDSLPIMRWRCRLCESPQCRDASHGGLAWEQVEVGRTWPAVSTDPAAMMTLIEKLEWWCIIAPPSPTRAYWRIEMEKVVGAGDTQARGATLMEAAAKAVAKTKGGER